MKPKKEIKSSKLCFLILKALNFTSSVSQYLSLLRNLRIPRYQINFDIFDEILCVIFYNTLNHLLFHSIIDKPIINVALKLESDK